MKLVLAALLLCSALSCSKPEEKPRRTEPWLATPSADPSAVPATGPLKLELLADSRARFTLTGRRAKPSGSVPLSSGSIELFPSELSRSKATLVFDLERIELTADSLPPDAELSGASPHELALRWLELGAGVAAEQRKQHSRAVFELSAVEDGATALELEPSKRGTRVTVVGSLRLHGFRAPVRTRVELRAQRSEQGTLQLAIRSLEPVVLSLVAHDIGARSESGVSEPAVTARWSDVVGKNVRVDLELLAEATSAAP